MTNDQLLGYVRRELRGHVPLEKLRRDLCNRQWPHEAIEEVLRIVADEEAFRIEGKNFVRQDYAADGFTMTGGREAFKFQRRSFPLAAAFSYMMTALLIAAFLLFLYARFAVHARVVQGAEISSFDAALERVFSGLLE
jgi:hypothetical protein